MILVTGASGQVGCSVIQSLKSMGLPVKAWIHREENKEKVLKAGADEVFIGDMNNEEDIRMAFQGVNTVYYICSAQNPAEDEIGKTMIETAKTQKDIYFVYHSVLHSLLEEMPHHKKKNTVEQMLIHSGLKFAIVQPTVFMQMLMPAINSVKNGGPAPQKFFSNHATRMNFIDLRDFSEAAANIIRNQDYAYGTYALAGSVNYSLADVEDAFNKASNRSVKTVFLEDDVFLSKAGISPDSYSGKTLLKIFAHYNTHSFLGNDHVFKMIVGRKPNTLYEFIGSCL